MNAGRPPEGGHPATETKLTRVPDTDAILEEVRSFQRTARRIVRDPALSFIQASMAVLRLIQEGRNTEAPETTVAAIWSEVRGFVGTGDPPMDRSTILELLAASDPVEQAIRAQLRKQHVRCETCLRLLPTEKELDHRRTLTRASLQDALLREEAV